MFVFMISVIVLMLGFVFVIFEGENHKSEICVRFVILKGKIWVRLTEAVPRVGLGYRKTHPQPDPLSFLELLFCGV